MTKHPTVLLVEDDPWLAELQVGALRQAGYDVTHAPHAPAAIAVIDTVRPDVIILDVLLPGTTAFGLLHELRSYEDTKAIPIILCTSMAETLDASGMAAYGVKRVVDKSAMDPADLVGAVRSVL
jgi:CheY-like chemotaxis protein